MESPVPHYAFMHFKALGLAARASALTASGS